MDRPSPHAVLRSAAPTVRSAASALRSAASALRSVAPALRSAVVVAVALAIAVAPARAHVDYVTPGGDPVAALGFLLDLLRDPVNLALLAGGALAVGAALWGYYRVRPLRHDVAVWRAALASYDDLLPWMLRLSVGLPLVGAGFSGYLFSPAVEPGAPAVVRLFGVSVGFLLLFGLASRAVAAVGLLGYLVALVVDPTVALAFEFVPGLLGIVLLGAGRPSADHVLTSLAEDGRTAYARIDPIYRDVTLPFRRRIEPYRTYVPTILRVGVGVAFCYLGITQKLLAPGPALAVVEKYQLTRVVPVEPAMWVVGAGLAEFLVGLLLVVGLATRGAASVAFLLLTTTLFGLPDDPVLAHVSLFGLVSALLVTGAGPLSLDARLAGETVPVGDDDRASPAD